MSLSFFYFIILLSIGGAANSIYLLRKHHSKHQVCPLNGNCHAVTESKWSRMFYFRNEVLGIAFFMVLILGAGEELIFGSMPFRGVFLSLMIWGGFIFSVFLVYLQIRVLKSYCLFCFLSAAITLILFVNNLSWWR